MTYMSVGVTITTSSSTDTSSMTIGGKLQVMGNRVVAAANRRTTHSSRLVET